MVHGDVEHGVDVGMAIHATVGGDVLGELAEVHHLGILCHGEDLLLLGLDEVGVLRLRSCALCLGCLDACLCLIDFDEIGVD